MRCMHECREDVCSRSNEHVLDLQWRWRVAMDARVDKTKTMAAHSLALHSLVLLREAASLAIFRALRRENAVGKAVDHP